MGDLDATARDLRAFLAKEVFLGRTPESIGLDDDLVSMGLDSLAVLRLVLHLEERYGMDVAGDDVLGEGLSTLRALAERCASGGD